MTLTEHTGAVIPEADRREQETPQDQDLRIGHEHPLDQPIADVLEQEIPLADVGEFPIGVDDDRLEPIDDTERSEEEVLLGGSMDQWGSGERSGRETFRR
jgi:hypothetical protein